MKPIHTWAIALTVVGAACSPQGPDAAKTTDPTQSAASATVKDPRVGFESLPAGPTQPNTGLKPFEYGEAADRLPNYVVSDRWGVQGDPITTMQKPIAPEDSLKHYVLPAGFEATLFAHEPQIFKPVAMAWDERGRLWIAETRDYPNELQPEGQGRDRLSILEDTNGDGKADKFTVFADKLSIPTTFTFANGGVIVLHSGRTELLKDTDGDDKADVRTVLFSGWSMGDTHATASSIRMGHDNWIWGVVGYSGFRGTVGGKEVRFGQGFFRFKPDGSALEFVRSSNNNTWGLGLAEDGVVFGSTANGNASMYMPIANRYYEAVNGWSAARVESIATSQNIYPITTKVRQVDQHGRYTAGAGHALYTARSFPKDYWNRVAFVTEPTGHLIGHFGLEAKGADYVSHNLKNFMASDDEWASPIMAEVGPDGALWVLDWYNYIIQHNPVPDGFKNGKGNAYETPLRDKTHGRIYRVAHKESKPTVQPPRLDKATPEQLVAVLKNDNMLWRAHAQRLLVERGQADVVPALLALVRDRSADEIGLNAGAIHALWTLQGLGVLESGHADALAAVTAALDHPSPGVRRNAALVLPHNEAGRAALVASAPFKDENGQVRLAAFLALADMPSGDDAGRAIFEALLDESVAGDRWLVHAATSAGARNSDAVVKAALSANAIASMETLPGESAGALRLVAGHHAAQAGTFDAIRPLLALARTAPPVTAVPVLEGLALNWPKDNLPTLNAEQEKELTDLMAALPEDSKVALLGLVDVWKRKDLFTAQIATLTRELSAKVADASLTATDRVRAARRLVGFEDSVASLRTIVGQTGLQSAPELSTGLISALGQSRLPDVAGLLVAQWDNFTPGNRRVVVSTLIRRPEWALALLQAVDSGKLVRSDLAAEHWQQLRRSRSREIGDLARRLDTIRVNPDMEATLNRIRKLTEVTGDPVNGKRVYEQNCAVCHIMDGKGVYIGPDLTGIGARAKSDFFVDIIDPNRSVEANYRLWTVTKNDEDSYSGRLESETQTSIEILDLTGQKHLVQRRDIKSLEVSPLSIMPGGFENLAEKDLTDLFEYMSTSKPH